MNSNQLIALLEIYRTGKPEKSGLETLEDDLDFLAKRKLIEKAVHRKGWQTTLLGDQKIEAILTLV